MPSSEVPNIDGFVHPATVQAVAHHAKAKHKGFMSIEGRETTGGVPRIDVPDFNGFVKTAAAKAMQTDVTR